MGQISQFLRKVEDGISHFCPACREMHVFHIDRPNIMGARWQWDGHLYEPTFSPSMNIYYKDPELELPDDICHYFLHKGILRYLPDCTHEFKGISMPLPPLPEHYRDPSWYV